MFKQALLMANWVQRTLPKNVSYCPYCQVLSKNKADPSFNQSEQFAVKIGRVCIHVKPMPFTQI